MYINRYITFILLFFIQISTTLTFVYADPNSESTWISTPIKRPGGDAQPTVIYDPSLGEKTFQMWWFGTRHDEVDLPLGGINPKEHGQSDRIFYSSSADGTNWTTARIVLRGLLGSGNYDAGDDHMVGSPSVLRIKGTYYMFYEAYGNWIAPLNLFYNADHGDSWLTPGVNTSGDPVGLRSGYRYSGHMGFAPLFRKHGTRPIYGGVTTYPHNKQVNHFLYRTKPNLEYTQLNGGKPLFWLFEKEAKGRVPIYSIWAGATWDTGVKNNPSHHPTLPTVELLGYAYANLDTEETKGLLQNKIMLATSPNGINWTRVKGLGTGKSIVNPENERTTQYNPRNGYLSQTEFHETWDCTRNYGAGYPSALVRGSHLELYYPDVSVSKRKMLKVPVNKAADPKAWVLANRNPNYVQFELGGEVAWSPEHNRYFIATLRQYGQAYPLPSSFQPWTIDNNSSFIQTPNVSTSSNIYELDSYVHDEIIKTSNSGTPLGHARISLWGTFARTPLGHTLDFPNGDGVVQKNYTSFHWFYPSVERTKMNSQSDIDNHIHSTDISHTLEFITHNERHDQHTILLPPKRKVGTDGEQVSGDLLQKDTTAPSRPSTPSIFSWSTATIDEHGEHTDKLPVVAALVDSDSSQNTTVQALKGDTAGDDELDASLTGDESGLWLQNGADIFFDKGNLGIGSSANTSKLLIDALDNQLILTNPTTNYGTALVYNTVAPFTTDTDKGALTFQSRNRNGEWNTESRVLASLDMDNGFLSAHGFLYFSDERLKENVKDIPDALAKIMRLRGVLFDWKEGEVENLGFIAQEVEKVFPETVETEKSTGYKSVQYASLVAPLVSALQEQQRQIEAQGKRIEVLEHELIEIRTLISQ